MICNTQGIILAAGSSSRLNNGRNKLTELLCGQPMIAFSVKILKELDIPTTLVVGKHASEIRSCLDSHNLPVSYAHQEKPLGTGDALRCTQNSWQQDHILVLNGDMPLVTGKIIQELYTKHIATDAAISFVIAHNTEPNTGYGRVIKNEQGVTQIIEAKEYTGDPTEHCCINAGIYLIQKKFLEQAIQLMQTNAVSREYHITELVSIACEKKLPVSTVTASFDDVRGINNQHELWAAEQILRSNIIKYWMEKGVRFSVAHNVHIDLNTVIGSGTSIGCGAHILYGSKIGAHCNIHEYVTLENCTVEDHATLLPFTVAKNSTLGKNSVVGPFAHIQDSTLAEKATIGNFVEVKRSIVGSHSKAKHLSYIGDTHIGNQVNIGAGTVTCNYDGFSKHKTVIKDHAFVGSNNTLIAPVTLEESCFTAGGSTITQDVPRDALAIARSLQINKLGYAHRHLKKLHKKSTLKTKTLENQDTQTKAQFIGAKRTTNDPIETENL